MSLSYPYKNETSQSLFMDNQSGKGGFYPLGQNNFWHGGIHLHKNKPVIAIADGKVVACRIDKTLIALDPGVTEHRYSTSFVCIKHKYTTTKGNKLDYYSLYMHLLPFDQYSNKKVPAFFDPGVKTGKIITSNDQSKGLKIRDVSKSRNDANAVLTVAPFGSILVLDSSEIDEVAEAAFIVENRRKSQYKRIKFTDHTGAEYKGYAFIDSPYVKLQSDGSYQISKMEDAMPNQALKDALNGLEMRATAEEEANYGNLVKILPKNQEIEYIPEGDKWAKVLDPEDNTKTLGYVIYKNNVELKPIIETFDEANYGKVLCPDMDIKAGDLLGYPSADVHDELVMHFEIFADDSLKTFITNPHDEGEKEILKITQGIKLRKREHKTSTVTATTDTIAKESTLAITETESSNYVQIIQITAQSHMLRSWLNYISGTTYEYNIEPSNFNEAKALFGGFLESSDKVNFEFYCNAEGDERVTSKPEDDASNANHRILTLNISESRQKKYWVKKEKVAGRTSGEYKTLEVLTELYDENPDGYKFETEINGAVVDNIYLTAEPDADHKFTDSENKLWYKIAVPYDGSEVSHYTSTSMGVARDIKKGWVAADDVTKISAFNWPGFEIAAETNGASADGFCDRDNLPDFFKKIFKEIDLDANNKISKRELKEAINNKKLAARMGKVITFHPSEWQADASLSKWVRLDTLLAIPGLPDETEKQIKKAKNQIKNLIWWDEAKSVGAALPASHMVYHVHPLVFVEQLKVIEATQGLTLEEAMKLALVGTSIFEGAWDSSSKKLNYGVLASNFDGAGLSMGLIQWNIKSRNFFTKLDAMYKKNPAKFKECYEAGNSDRFKPYFEGNSTWDSDDYEEIWKFDIFKDFIGAYELATEVEPKSKIYKCHYLWAKLLHKPGKIKTLSEGASYLAWKTKPGVGHASALQAELIDFFKRLGECTDFQEIQYEEAANGSYMKKAIKELKWLRSKTISSHPELLKRIEIRSFAAMFDLCVQHGDLNRARSVIEDKINAGSFSSQYELLKMVVIARAKAGNTLWVNNSVSRRMGFLNAQATKIEGMGGDTYKVQNENFKKFENNKTISDFYE